MPTPIEQLLSRTVYTTDGTTVNWDFSFASGYLDAAHVKAQTKNAEGAITQIVVTPGMLIGEFQLQITPALASSLTLTIYRDTPKNAPLVDFNDESGFSEIALDTNAKQAVMVAAEAIDTINASDLTAAIEAAESAGAAAAAASASAALAAASVASIGTAVTDAEAAASAAIAAAASINPASFATAAQGALADSALQPGEAATPAQGAKADSALQPTAIGTSVQAHDANTAKLNANQTWPARQSGTPTALTDAATIAVNLGASNNFTVTLAGDRTLGTPTGAVVGTSGVIAISQDATGSRTLLFASAWDFPAGSDTAISPGANEVTLLAYYVISPTKIRVGLSKD